MSTTADALRIGVIGCGDILRSIYTPLLEGLADIDVVGVCDLNFAVAAGMTTRFPKATPYADARAMMSEIRLDAVLVLTPEKANAATARLVLGAGLPVYLEKPPAVTPAELEDLAAAESVSGSTIYTAFNRRHVPLSSQFALPGAKLRHISGALRRTDRAVGNFPYTAVHLIDSSQYYGGSPLENWKVSFTRGTSGACWMVDGRLKNGATCTLQFVPDGDDFVEFLRMETEEIAIEMQFPHPSATVPEGELITRLRDGQPLTVTRGNKSMADVEARGYRGSLETFLRDLKGGDNARHRLSACRSSVAIMDEMLQLCQR